MVNIVGWLSIPDAKASGKGAKKDGTLTILVVTLRNAGKRLLSATLGLT
jgi:hypothetical protein